MPADAASVTVLYLTYDGITDPLGQSQVVPYLLGLRRLGYKFHVVSCEKPARFRMAGAAARTMLSSHGIEWTALSYTRRPPVLSTLYDITRVRAAVTAIARENRIALIHCRSYVPSVVGARAAARIGVPFVFDMRGFWPDEKVEAGAWPLANPLYRAVYRTFKREEGYYLRAAAGVVVLTNAARDDLIGGGRTAADRMAVIPCSVDFDLFRVPTAAERAAARARFGFAVNDYVAAYAGSLGTWYMLDEMLQFFAHLRAVNGSGTRLLVLTPDSPTLVSQAAVRLGIPADAVRVASVAPEEVPVCLAAADAGLSFVRATPSKVASSPTKIAEYLAMGLPVAASSGIGDTDEIMADVNAGVVVHDFRDERLREAAARLVTFSSEGGASRRDRARRWFDLDVAVDRYADLYGRVLARGRAAASGTTRS